MGEKPAIGSIGWRDLTVGDAEGVSQFYSEVVGWERREHAMGDYHDFDILDAEGRTVAGICHARGPNADLPPQWLLYVTVADVGASAARCTELGGKVLEGPRKMGASDFCVVQDPAGAVLALIS